MRLKPKLIFSYSYFFLNKITGMIAGVKSFTEIIPVFFKIILCHVLFQRVFFLRFLARFTGFISLSPAASSALGHGPRNALILDNVTVSKSSFLGIRPVSSNLSLKRLSAQSFVSSDGTPQRSFSIKIKKHP